jgi:hypothetical protein
MFGSAELFGARLGLVQRFGGGEISLTRLSSRHMSLEGASVGIPPLQIWRERDLLVVSSREDAIERVRTRLEPDSRVRSLREQHLFKRVSEPLEGELTGDSIFAFLDCGLLLKRGIDVEALVTDALTQDGRAMALESIDFAAWRSAGVAVAAGTSLRARVAVALDPEAGARMKRLAKVYRERPGELVTPQVLPDGAAVAKTAALPFNVFFDLVFSSLTPETRENVNYYVLDQLQSAASAIRPEYADLVSHLTACMGEEFTVFAVPSGFTGDEELVNYWPRVGVIFPTRNAAAVRLLIRDIARVLPQINPDLFSREENRPVERGDIMVFNVQSDFAPLRTLYQITPTFLVSDSYVALLSSSEMVDDMVAAMHGEARSSRHRPPLAHGAFSIDSSALEELLVDAWYEHRKPYLSHETTLRDQRAEELLRERMLEEGVSQLGSTQLSEWRQWAYSIVDDPEEDAIIQEKLRSYLKPLRDAWIERAALVRGLGRIEVEATYSSTRLILSVERTPPAR